MLRFVHGMRAARATLLFIAATGFCAAAAAPTRAAEARVDVQIGLCGDPATIERALALRPTGTPREVWLFDDPSLSLFKRGLRLRLRVGTSESELTLKAADQDCARGALQPLPAEEGKCEYDLHGTSVAGALSLSRRLKPDETRKVLGGELAIADALSPAQVKFLREQDGIWPLPPGLRPLGPQKVASYGVRGKSYAVDVSRLPGGEVYVEISRKVALADAGRQHDALTADLAAAGVTACADQSGQAIAKLRALLR